VFPYRRVLVDGRYDGGRGNAGRALDESVAVAIHGRAIDVALNRAYGRGLGIVAGIGAEAVLEAEEGRLGAVLQGNQVAHACRGDQFLAFEHAAQQQADDDQHDGDFDQREALFFFHVASWRGDVIVAEFSQVTCQAMK